MHKLSALIEDLKQREIDIHTARVALEALQEGRPQRLSPEGRAAISAAAKKRWAEARTRKEEA